MPIKSVILKVIDVTGNDSSIKVVPGSGEQALRLQAEAGRKYIVMDESTKFAPQEINVQKSGQDLLISFTEADNPDVIIEQYYNLVEKDSVLLGQHENGQYYQFVPSSGQENEAIYVLAEHKVVSQALGGDPVSLGEPVHALESSTTVDSVASSSSLSPTVLNSLYLAGAGLLGGGVGAYFAGHKDKSTNDNSDKLKDNIAELNDKIDKLAELKGLKDKLAELDGLKDKLTELARLKDKLTELDGLKDKVAQLDGLKDKLAELKDKLDKLTELDGLKDKLTELDGLKDKLTELDGLKDKLTELDGLKDKLTELDGLKDKLAELKDKIEKLEEKLDHLPSDDPPSDDPPSDDPPSDDPPSDDPPSDDPPSDDPPLDDPPSDDPPSINSIEMTRVPPNQEIELMLNQKDELIFNQQENKVLYLGFGGFGLTKIAVKNFHIGDFNTDTDADRIVLEDIVNNNIINLNSPLTELEKYFRVVDGDNGTIINYDDDGDDSYYPYLQQWGKESQHILLQDVHCSLAELLENHQLVF